MPPNSYLQLTPFPLFTRVSGLSRVYAAALTFALVEQVVKSLIEFSDFSIDLPLTLSMRAQCGLIFLWLCPQGTSRSGLILGLVVMPGFACKPVARHRCHVTRTGKSASRGLTGRPGLHSAFEL
jgi:hypothetical protein